MNSGTLRSALPAAALLAMLTAPARAQPLPEQQLYALQQQLAAAQAAAIRFEQRLGALERQLQQIIDGSETSAHRLQVLESAIQELRAEQDSRLAALERGTTAAPPPATAAAPAAGNGDTPPSPAPQAQSAPAAPAATVAVGESDPGEDAYSEGFRLWEARRYDAAIASLRAFTSAFPKHRRVSWANNLTGRALLDKGEPRAAAEVLLANYRSNPGGGRAQDSLYYLGQALMKLGQPSQACKAYAELASVYGTAVRADLQALVDTARAEANCG
jgi:TolA-binding protein